MDVSIHVGESRQIDIKVTIDPEPSTPWSILNPTYQTILQGEIVDEGIPTVDQDTHIMTVVFAPSSIGVHRIRVDFWVGTHHLTREHEITVRGL